MVLAELELFQSRPIAPTRRVALGSCLLPVSPAPGFGGILLGAVAAAFVGQVDADLHGDLERLTHQLELGRTIPQPRLRHRYQTDHVGLTRRIHRLTGDGERLHLDLDLSEGTSPGPQVLAVVYAAGRLPIESRGPVMRVVRRGLRWRGSIDDKIIAAVSGQGAGLVTAAARYADPEAWALTILGLAGPLPERRDVQRRFRELLRVAHPDHGGGEGAAERIAELTEARRILLAS
ncbi:MAG TPA: hypothetical protein VGO60_00125 [Iamia sp.]|jgi:hypothetical protein|nr:hypothetical protein [Iamia sp.]